MDILQKIKELIPKLDLPEQYELEIYLDEFRSQDLSDIYNSLNNNVNSCPHCQSEKIIIWGNYNGNKRFMCKSCKHTFTATTGTVLHNLKQKDSFIKYSSKMLSGGLTTISELSSEVNVSSQTGFEWRHRLLISLRENESQFNGITEMDDVWLLYSQKGRKGLEFSRKRGGSKRKGDHGFQSKLLITKERGGDLDMSLACIGRISSDDITRKVGGQFGDDVLLTSDKHSSISCFAKNEKIKHESFLAKEHAKNQIVHVQTVNNIAGRFKDIVNRNLRGVATKYLQNYATWFKILEVREETKDRVKKILNIAINNKKAWDVYTNIEKLYEQFILNHSVRTYRCPAIKSWKYQNWNFENAQNGEFL